MPKLTSVTKKTAAGGRGSGKKARGSAPKAKSPAVRKAPPPPGDSGGKALYVLAIMVLLAAVVFMANRLYFQQGVRPGPEDRSRREAAVVDKKDDIKTDGRKKAEIEKGEKKETASGDKKDDARPVLAPERDVRLYFLRFDEKTEKLSPAWAKRTIRAEVPLLGAMQELTRGLSKKEERSGLLTALPPGLAVRGVVIRERVAYIDFNEALERNAVGSILMNRIDQIVFTATQFEGVEGVVIKINGVERSTIGPDGLALARPLTRVRR